MKLRDLSERIKLPIRRLRYVLDHDLVPPRDWFLQEDVAGRPRSFDDTGAVIIACVAFLLEAGHKRDAIRDLIKKISSIQPKRRDPLNRPMFGMAINSRKAARVQLGDRTHVRWFVGRESTGWIKCGKTRSQVADFSPNVIIEIDVGHIRDQVLART